MVGGALALCLGIGLAGCGRVDFDVLRLQVDAMGASDATVPTACASWSAFSVPASLPGSVQTGFDDWFPAPALGETLLFLHSNPVNAADIFVASRASRADVFGAPVLVMEVSIPNGGDKTPSVTEDGLVLVMQTDRGGDPDVYEARRSDPSSPFGVPQPLTELNTTFTEKDVFISFDGLRVVYSSNLGGPLELYEAVRPTRDMPFGSPMLLGLGMAGSRALSATLSADGLTIFFASNRGGGPGAIDVYWSERAALDQPFGAPVLVPELSSPLDDVGMRLSVDGATMYMNYNTVEAGGANADVQTATRTCLD